MFICPIHDRPVRLDDSSLLSTHCTATGGLAYFRCLCDGFVIAVAPLNGQVVGHAAGPDQTVAERAGHRACA